jgi:hypothetical protein
MEKDIGRLTKNQDTEIVVRIDDFGGKIGVTIREFVKSERYTGFTKAGVRISTENFKAFKEMINSIDENELAAMKPSEEAIEKSKNFAAKKSQQPQQPQQKLEVSEGETAF